MIQSSIKLLWNQMFVDSASCLLCHKMNANALCSGCLNDLRGLFTRPSEQHCPDDALWQAQWHSAHYQPPLPALLHDWKHLHRSALVNIFNIIMLENPPIWLPDAPIDAILPMPISPQRRLLRGFNQCDELAQSISETYGYPILPPQTVFRQHRPPQSSLNKAQRQDNIRHIFRVQGDVSQKNLLLIDDITTTGTTLTELAHTLKQAGAGRLFVWVAARKK